MREYVELERRGAACLQAQGSFGTPVSSKMFLHLNGRSLPWFPFSCNVFTGPTWPGTSIGRAQGGVTRCRHCGGGGER